MQEQYEKTKVLITVMTYPHPSKSYKEIVCTAGITEKNEWVRLYPIDYRYRLPSQQFHKYQWIDVGLLLHGSGNDNRKESRKPDLSSIELIGAPLSTDNCWHDRRQIIDRVPFYTLNELKKLNTIDKTSLGLVKPTRVLDLKVEKCMELWEPEWQLLFDRFALYGPQLTPLIKIPYKFSYVFECKDSLKPHNAMIEDWELGILFINEKERLGSEEKAAQSVRNYFYNQLCASDRDTKFYMGTKFPYNTWLVLGVYCPPVNAQTKLL